VDHQKLVRSHFLREYRYCDAPHRDLGSFWSGKESGSLRVKSKQKSLVRAKRGSLLHKWWLSRVNHQQGTSSHFLKGCVKHGRTALPLLPRDNRGKAPLRTSPLSLSTSTRRMNSVTSKKDTLCAAYSTSPRDDNRAGCTQKCTPSVLLHVIVIAERCIAADNAFGRS